MFKPTPKVLACVISTALLTSPSYGEVPDDTQDIAQDLEVIVISGSRTEKALKDVAGSISVVTSQDIEKQVVTDMNQLFKYAPGVEVTGSAGGAQNILVRGMGSDRVLMIKDGMRMNEGYGADGLNDIVGRGFIETDTLKQVEVAKGAASSLYGSDALGGIIVFTTKDASDYLDQGETFAGSVKTGYDSSTEQESISSTFAFAHGAFEHLLNLNYRDGHEQQNYDESEQPFAIQSDNIFYKGKYKLNNEDYLTFTAEHWQQESKGDSADGLLTYFRGLGQYGYQIVDENINNDKTTESYKLSYHSESGSSFYDLLNVSLYKNKTIQRDEEYGRLDINAPMFGVFEIRDMWKTSRYQQDTVGFLSNASLEINSTHTLGYGLDIEKTESSRLVHEYREVAGESTRDLTEEKFPKTDTSRTGLFLNDEITLVDGQLTLTPGIRFDRYSMDPNGALKADGISRFSKIDENHTSFNFGALYRLSDDISLFAQYGQGFKVPAYDLAYIEHYNQASSSYIYEVTPSDDLSPEESDSYELGLRGTLGDFAFNTAVYYTKYDQFLATTLSDSETVMNDDGSFAYQHDIFQYQNIDAVTIKGIEAAVNYDLNHEFNIFFNASYQHGKDDETDEYIETISPLSGIAGLGYMGDKLNAELILNWANRMTKVPEGKSEIAGYASLDLLMSYQLTDEVIINLSATNLTDKEYIRYANATGHSEGDSKQHLTEAGRAFSVSAKMTF